MTAYYDILDSTAGQSLRSQRDARAWFDRGLELVLRLITMTKLCAVSARLRSDSCAMTGLGSDAAGPNPATSNGRHSTLSTSSDDGHGPRRRPGGTPTCGRRKLVEQALIRPLRSATFKNDPEHGHADLERPLCQQYARGLPRKPGRS